jgi:flagellar hook-associated protein 2
MRLQGSYLAKTASSSNESIVKVSASGQAAAGSYSIKVTALAGNARLNSSEAVSFDAGKTNLQEQLGLTSSDPIVFTVNGKEISIEPSTDTIDTLVSKINNAGAGVSASFDKTLNRMFISSTATGAAAAIDFDDVSNAGELFSTLKLDDPFTAVSGTDALFELKGTLLSQASNKFTIAGVTYTLTGASAGETVSVNVTRDTDAIYESIKAFVDLYNSTIDKINSRLMEKRDKSYLPLTDA